MGTRVEGSGVKEKQGTPWVVDVSVSQVVMNVVTVLPANARYTDRFSEVRTLFNGKGSIVEVPLYAIDNAELHDYVDNWLEALRIASEHAVVMRKPGLANIALGRHGSSFDMHALDDKVVDAHQPTVRFGLFFFSLPPSSF